MWRNWYTRTVQNRISQELEVQILSCPQLEFLTGRSIPVVHILREDVDWVRFPAARTQKVNLFTFVGKRKAFPYLAKLNGKAPGYVVAESQQAIPSGPNLLIICFSLLIMLKLRHGYGYKIFQL
jgi:hypothetical protein